MGNVKCVPQFVLDVVQKQAALLVIGRLDLDMGREGEYM
jgi:hypothetical protein